jgi:hypothetical protein
MVSTNQLDITAAADQWEKQQQWLSSLKDFTLSDQAGEFLTNGNVYLGGRDKEGYPSLWVYFGSIKVDAVSTKDLANAMTFAALVCKKFMMVPHYLDKFNVIFDVNNRGPSTLPMRYLPEIMTLFKDNFNGFNCRSLILNPPFTFSMAWGLVKKMIPERTQKKFVILKSKETPKILEFFDESQLEVKYLGTESNYAQGAYWPPKVFDFFEKQILNEENAGDRKIAFFNLWDEESDMKYFFSRKIYENGEADQDADSFVFSREGKENGEQKTARVFRKPDDVERIMSGLKVGMVLVVFTLAVAVYFMISGARSGVAA